MSQFVFSFGTHLGMSMLVPIGTHFYFHLGHTWASPLGHAHVGPNWDPLLFSFGTHLGLPTWACPCWSQLGPTFILIWDTPGPPHLGMPMLVPIGTHFYFHLGHTWASPLGHAHVGPNWDPLLFSFGTHLGLPTWACPCWSQLGPTFIFIWDTPGPPHLGMPMLVPIGTHFYFNLGHTWASPHGHAHVGPNWDPLLFSFGTHLGLPTWACPCWSQLGPTFIFIWDTPGPPHLGMPMLVPTGTHFYFHLGHTWASPLGHAHVGPNWDPLLFSFGTHLGLPTWACPCWSHLGPTLIFIWDTPGPSHLGMPMLVPIGTHFYFHLGHIWASPLGHAHVGPNWDPLLFFIWDTPGPSHLGMPMLVPIGTHFYFHLGHIWASPLGHAHVGPNWDPLLFLFGTHMGIPM